MPVDFIELNKGPVVAIDDEIGQNKDIDDIISKIEEEGLPVLKYTTLEKVNNEIDNICFSNFILLDWRMFLGEPPVGVSMGDELTESLNKKKVGFIKKIKSVCFSPIFIFTNLSKEDIEEEIEKPLKENDLLYSDYGKNFIFIMNKQELLKKGETLFDIIEKWIFENLHIYFSKIWLNQFLKNSNEIFWSLYKKNSNWPNVFYKSFEKDGEDPVSGLNDILFRLVIAKTNLDNIDGEIFKKDVEELNMGEKIKTLYSEIMYLKGNIDDIKPGDIYKDGIKYYINIRPECDTTQIGNVDINETYIYLIKGKKEKDDWVKNNCYNKKYGLFNRPVFYILPFLDGKNFVKFTFEDLEIKKYSDIKDKKLYRLLPPFITSFQHHFSSFLGRYGVPKVPQEVFNEIFKKKDENNAR